MRRLLPLLLLVPLAGCSASAEVSSGKTADDGRIEEGIKRSVEQSTGSKVTDVACPSDIKAKVGTTFSCPVTARDGTKATAKGRITSTKKGGRYEADTSVLNTGQIQTFVAEDIKRQTNTEPDVDCPDLIVVEKGAKTTCDATVGKTTRKAVLTQKDAAGSIRYQLR